MSTNSLDGENIGHQEKLQGEFNTFTGRVSLTELNYNLQQKHNHYVCAVKLWLISSVWVTRSTTTSLSLSQSKDWQINTHTHTPLDRKRCVASRSCGEVLILGSPSGGLKRENSSWTLRGSRGISSGARGRFTFLSTAGGDVLIKHVGHSNSNNIYRNLQ